MASPAPDAHGAASAVASADAKLEQSSRDATERLSLRVAPPIAGSGPHVAASAQPAPSTRDTTPRATLGALADRKLDSSEGARRSEADVATLSGAPVPPPSALAPLRSALVNEPGRWSWSGDGRRVQRVTPELLAWLARLDAALAAQPTDGRASASAPESEDAAPPVPAPAGPVRALVLLREGRRHTELRLGDALEVTPIDPPGPRWRAGLAPEAAAALRESLP